jgi:hypothetical protein
MSDSSTAKKEEFRHHHEAEADVAAVEKVRQVYSAGERRGRSRDTARLETTATGAAAAAADATIVDAAADAAADADSVVVVVVVVLRPMMRWRSSGVDGRNATSRRRVIIVIILRE